MIRNDAAEYTSIDKARYHLGLARTLINEGGERWRIVNRIRAAFNRLREEWLVRQGLAQPGYMDKYECTALFSNHAPEEVWRICDNLDDRLSDLYYNQRRLADRIEYLEGHWEIWRTEAEQCIATVVALAAYVEHGKELPILPRQRENRYVPGQWVRLQCFPSMVDRRSYTIPAEGPPYFMASYLSRKVLAVEGRKLILCDSDHIITRHAIDNPGIEPSNQPTDDMTTPFARRRVWFDLHPAYRQIPLGAYQPSKYDHALFHACPCCGYPMLRHGPGFSSEDDEEFYEICMLCDWANLYWSDDDHNQDEVSEENYNFGHTLRSARENFEQHQCMFDPRDGVCFSYQTTLDILRLKTDLRTIFDAMVEESSAGKIYLLWHMAIKARQNLAVALQEAEKVWSEPLKVARDACRCGRDFTYKWDDRFAWFDARPWGRDLCGDFCRVIRLGMSDNGYVVTLRYTNRSLREATWPGVYETTSQDGDDLLHPFYVYRTWFETHPEILRGHTVCPCCGYPTLTPSEKVCFLCEWTDDGQDDHDQADVNGCNADYSLREARHNFSERYTMCRADAVGTIPSKYTLHDKLVVIGFYHKLIIETDCSAWDGIWASIEQIRSDRETS